MKKILLGTTALVAATAISAGVAKADVAITGFMYQAFGTSLDSDNNTSQNDGLQSYQNSNITFKASTELDNGMTMSFKRQENTANRSIGGMETNFSLADDWGTLVLGGDDGAADVMHAGGAWIAGGAGLDGGVYSGLASNYGTSVAFMSTTSSMYPVSDLASINYFSPDMNGLSFGISYAPDGAARNWSSAGTDGVTNIFSVGGAFSSDMGGAAVTLSGGVEHAANSNNEGAGGDDDQTAYRVGADIGVGGFGINLGYAAADYKTSTTAQVDQWTANAVVSYSMGQHTFGVEGQLAETTGTVGGQSTDAQNFAVDYSMDIGSGVYWDAHIAWLDIDVPGSTSSDVDATIFQAGVGVSF